MWRPIYYSFVMLCFTLILWYYFIAMVNKSHQPIREQCVVMKIHVSNEYYYLFWSWLIMTEANVDSTHLHLITSLFLFKHCPVVLNNIMLDVLNGSAFDKPVSFTNALIIIMLNIISRVQTIVQMKRKWKRLSTELLPYVIRTI